MRKVELIYKAYHSGELRINLDYLGTFIVISNLLLMGIFTTLVSNHDQA